MVDTTANGGFDDRVAAVVETGVEELGGFKSLVQRGELGVVPALVEAACVVVLSEDERRSPEDIAEQLGLSVGAVRSVLEAPMEGFLSRLRGRADELTEEEAHTPPEWTERPDTSRLEDEYSAGALAKFAYSVVRRSEGAPP